MDTTDGKSISIGKAISRLRSPQIGNVEISDKEAARFNSAIRLRNEFVHYECAFQAEQVEAKFAEIFAFMIFFYDEHLGLGRHEIVTQSQYDAIFRLKSAKAELHARALQYIQSHDLGAVWMCPDCLEDTFVVGEESCRLCGYTEKVLECPNCQEAIFEFEKKDVSELFDYSIDEGRVTVHDNFGYDVFACPNCIGGIKEDIKEKRFAKYVEDMEMEYHLNRISSANP